jgi:hypothetical protein
MRTPILSPLSSHTQLSIYHSNLSFSSDRRPVNLKRMRLSIKHPLILPLISHLPNSILSKSATYPFTHKHSSGSTYRRLRQIGILQHLRKEEAIHEIIEPAATRRINISQLRVPTTDRTRVVDRQERVPRPVAVHLIASSAVGVVHALKVLGPQYVVAVGDVEAGFLVEGFLVSGCWRVVGVCG